MEDLDSLLGVFLSNLDLGNITTLDVNSNICCPDCIKTSTGDRIYIIASVETFLQYYTVDNNLPCNINLYASIGTSLQFSEAIGTSDIANSGNYPNNFNDCVSYLTSGFGPSSNNTLLSVGIVEYGSLSGSSQICRIKDFVDLAYESQGNSSSLTKIEILENILNKGIVINCIDDELIVSSLSTYLLWLESSDGAVPT